MLKHSKITGVGHFLPDNVVTNYDLEKVMDTTHDWIVERTGIHERRWIKYGEHTTASMGAEAGRKAIESAGLEASDIDFIILATLSPDYIFPGPGVKVQDILGMDTIGALDVRNQCSGFIYSLSIADQFIKTGMYKNILIIGSEIHSHRLDKSTRGRAVTVIFGDGAGAAVLSAHDQKGIGLLSTHLHSQGKYAEELAAFGPGNCNPEIVFGEPNPMTAEQMYPHMNGSMVFKHAIVRFHQVIMEGLKANGKDIEDLDFLIPHQANLRISQFLQKQLDLPDEKVYNNIQRYGNTTAASIPIALSEALSEGKINKGDLLVMAAFGSGFTWASAVFKWD